MNEIVNQESFFILCDLIESKYFWKLEDGYLLYTNNIKEAKRFKNSEEAWIFQRNFKSIDTKYPLEIMEQMIIIR